jgi:hypothetical protein
MPRIQRPVDNQTDSGEEYTRQEKRRLVR